MKPISTDPPDKINKKYVGAHVSISGGIEFAPLNAAKIGARAFALFLKNQRQWHAKDYDQNGIEAFKKNCAEHHFHPQHILAHSSYLINLGHPESEGYEKSKSAFLDEIKRCEQLGLLYINVHPGTHLKKITPRECMSRIASAINWTLEQSEQSKGVSVIIENTAGQGSWVGQSFEELAEIIDGVKDKSRVGVCLDTCHLHAAGYDLSSEAAFSETMRQFNLVVGDRYLKGIHLNDAKSTQGSHLDRHHNLGKGEIGIKIFKLIMNDSRFDNIPLILETPDDSLWSNEIKKLYSFVTDKL
ncbi:MAG: deoxyribonuclease IV [Oligoflexia bacterium]|nr:deoxyribonuclease IV [Oligoflexia bacterium]